MPSGHGAILLLTIIQVITDIVLNIGDVATDFTFGYELFEQRNEEGKESFQTYGIVVWFITWIPGIVATMFVLSTYRHDLGPKYSLFIVLLLLLFFPIVAVFANLLLLWTRPKVNLITSYVKLSLMELTLVPTYHWNFAVIFGFY